MNAFESKRRWFHPTPGWLVLGSLVVTGLLYLSERYRWFAFNQHKGWTVLIAVASVVAVLAVTLVWWIAALVFRWRFQFSVRSLLLWAVAFALPCSWLGVERERAKSQEKMLVWITTFDGAGRDDRNWWMVDWQVDSAGNYLPNAVPPGPAWLRYLMGNYFFDYFQVLSLQGKEVTDARLTCLDGQTRLRDLMVVGTQVTNDGLAFLDEQSNLQYLTLAGTQFSDDGLKHLRALTRIKSLDLTDTAVGDNGLEELKALSQLEQLVLNHTRVADAGLEHLKGFIQLHILLLNDTQVTNAGLDQLRGLCQLRLLSLKGTRVTAGGVAKLKTVLPNCKIYR